MRNGRRCIAREFVRCSDGVDVMVLMDVLNLSSEDEMLLDSLHLLNAASLQSTG